MNYIQRARTMDRAAFVASNQPHYLFLCRESLHSPQPANTVDDTATVSSGAERAVVEPPPSLHVFALAKAQLVHPDMITLGRTANNDIVLSDVSVSKFHAYVRVPSGGLHRETGGVELCDAGSHNGTYVTTKQRLKVMEPVFVALNVNARFGLVTMSLLDAAGLWDALHALAPATT